MIDQNLGPVYNFVTQNLTKDEKKFLESSRIKFGTKTSLPPGVNVINNFVS